MPKSIKNEINSSTNETNNKKKERRLTKTGKTRKLTRRREKGGRIPLFLYNK
jgi:hypothetical protein